MHQLSPTNQTHEPRVTLADQCTTSLQGQFGGCSSCHQRGHDATGPKTGSRGERPTTARLSGSPAGRGEPNNEAPLVRRRGATWRPLNTLAGRDTTLPGHPPMPPRKAAATTATPWNNLPRAVPGSLSSTASGPADVRRTAPSSRCYLVRRLDTAGQGDGGGGTGSHPRLTPNPEGIYGELRPGRRGTRPGIHGIYPGARGCAKGLAHLLEGLEGV